MSDLSAGWGWPLSSRKAHWFPEGEFRSICGKWAHTGPREVGTPGGPDDCAACVRKLAR